MRRLSAVLLTVWPVALCLVIQACALRAQDCTRAEEIAAKLEARLNDWASLSRYRDSNAELRAPGSDERRVVFLGDSITDLWDEPGYGGFFPGRPYINRGISSQTTPQMLVRFRRDVIGLQPRAVVIRAGTNDIAGVTGPTTLDAIADNLASMAELAHAHGIRVVFASLLPTNDYATNSEGRPIVHSKSRPPEAIKALNERIKAYATSHGHIFLDYYSAMADESGSLRRELSNDGIHANAKGYAVMAPLAEQAIAAALKSHEGPRAGMHLETDSHDAFQSGDR
jgi:lysophospholipase L1-like esterase